MVLLGKIWLRSNAYGSCEKYSKELNKILGSEEYNWVMTKNINGKVGIRFGRVSYAILV